MSAFPFTTPQSTADVSSSPVAAGAASGTAAASSSSSSPDGINAILAELLFLGDRIRQLEVETGTGHASELTLSQDVTEQAFTSVLGMEVCFFAKSGDLRALEKYIAAMGSSVTLVVNQQGMTPVHAAVAAGRLEVIQLFIRAGGNVHPRDADGRTPLDLAVALGHSEIAALLNEQHSGSHTSLGSSGGGTALGCSDDGPSGRTLKNDSFTAVTPGSGGAASATASQLQSLSAMTQSVAQKREVTVVTRSPFFHGFEGLVLIMVGLPARGKSFVSKKMVRYGTWSCIPCLRSVISSRRVQSDSTSGGASVTFVDTCRSVSEEVTLFLKEHAGIAIVDGTHTTRDRRTVVYDTLLRAGVNPRQIIFIEIVHDNATIIEQNIRMAVEEARVKGQDVEGYDERYREIIASHERVYQTMSPVLDRQLSFIQMKDQQEFFLHRIDGTVPTRLVYMLQNLRHTPKAIILCRTGEWADKTLKRLGGDSPLTPNGFAFARRLHQFVTKMTQGRPFLVLHSATVRAAQTCAGFRRDAGTCEVRALPTLNDVSYGDCDGMDQDEAQRLHGHDPFTEPWPNGESVQQVFLSRLEQHIHEINSSEVEVVVVSHKPLLQGLLMYFSDETFTSPADALRREIPLHHVYRIAPGGPQRFCRYDLTADLPEGGTDATDALPPGEEVAPLSLLPATDGRTVSDMESAQWASVGGPTWSPPTLTPPSTSAAVAKGAAVSSSSS